MALFTVGIDIGKNTHTASILSVTNKSTYAYTEPISFCSKGCGFKKFIAYLEGHEVTPANCIIGLEATGHYWFTLSRKLKEKGYVLYVINPLQVDAHRNSTSVRRLKTDRVDCKLIAKTLQTGENMSPMEEMNTNLFVLKHLCRFRWELGQQLGRLKQQSVVILDIVFPEYSEIFSDVFGTASVDLLSFASTPEDIANISVEDLTLRLEKASRKQFSRAVAERLKREATDSFGLAIGVEGFSLQLKFLCAHIQQLSAQISFVEKEIKKLVEAQKTKLLSIPGIGYLIAGTILGETESFRKMQEKDYRPLLAFAGLDVAIRESGMYVGKGKMSKRGNTYLRLALMQAALVASQRDEGFKEIYSKQKAKGKHHMVCLSHVADKLTAVVHAVINSGKEYVPILAYAKQKEAEKQNRSLTR